MDMSSRPELKIFSGSAHRDLAQSIAQSIGITLGDASVKAFPDGETSVRINENIRGRDVFIIQPTCPPVNHNLMELLVLVDAARRASAARITAVMPFFGYARQDRKDRPRVPITAKLVANLITAAGVNRVLTVDLHAQQIQGFFDIPVDHLYALPVFLRHFRTPGHGAVGGGRAGRGGHQGRRCLRPGAARAVGHRRQKAQERYGRGFLLSHRRRGGPQCPAGGRPDDHGWDDHQRRAHLQGAWSPDGPRSSDARGAHGHGRGPAAGFRDQRIDHHQQHPHAPRLSSTTAA